MAFFFVPIASAKAGEVQTLTGDTVHRLLNVRRFKIGDEIQVQTEDGKRYLAEITEVSSRSMSVKLVSEAQLPVPQSREIRLAIGYISENNLDLVIQKSTELGASEIIIFQAEHSPHAIKSDRLAHKLERWNAIALNACEQLGRPTPPVIRYVDSISKALLHSAQTTCIFLEQNTKPFRDVKLSDATPITLFIGPEGGWSEPELDLITTNPVAKLVSIAPFTLRAETAAIAGLTLALQT